MTNNGIRFSQAPLWNYFIYVLEDISASIDSLIRTVIVLNLFISYTHLEASIHFTGDPINRLKGWTDTARGELKIWNLLRSHSYSHHTYSLRAWEWHRLASTQHCLLSLEIKRTVSAWIRLFNAPPTYLLQHWGLTAYEIS